MSEETGDEVPMLIEVKSSAQVGLDLKPGLSDRSSDRVPITVITGIVLLAMWKQCKG